MSIRRKSIIDGTTISKKMKRTIDERDSEVPKRGEGEQGKVWRTKNRKYTRCANARDDKRTGSPTENHSFTARNPYRGKTRGQVRVKTRLRCRTSQGKYKVMNYVDKTNLEWNTELIEAMELEHVMSQAAQDLNDGETRHESWKAQAQEHEYLLEREEVQWTKTHKHQFIKRRLVSSTARPHEPRRCA